MNDKKPIVVRVEANGDLVEIGSDKVVGNVSNIVGDFVPSRPPLPSKEELLKSMADHMKRPDIQIFDESHRFPVRPTTRRSQFRPPPQKHRRR